MTCAQAASQPAEGAQLLTKLQYYNNSHCDPHRCEPDGQRADAGPRTRARAAVEAPTLSRTAEGGS